MNDVARSRGLIVFLGALVAVGPLSIDMYLPSLPAITAELGAQAQHIQLTLSVFLLGFCIGMLFYGPLSDRLGRRPLLLGGIALYVVGSLGCMLASDATELVWLRLIQALGGGAAAVLGRTIVVDLFATSDAGRVLSLMQAVTLLAPLVAPLLGGHLAQLFGWRSIFALLSLFGVVCFVLVKIGLPESHPPHKRATGGVGQAIKGYGVLLRDVPSAALIFGGGSAFAGMFIYITATPYVYIQYFGVPATSYGYLFGLNIVGVLLMTLLNARLLRRHRPEALLLVGSGIAAASGLALMLVTVFDVGGLYAIVVLLLSYMSVTGLIGANGITILMTRHQRSAGTAAAAFGVARFGFGALGSACVGLFPGPAGMGALICVCGVCCLMGTYVAMRCDPN